MARTCILRVFGLQMPWRFFSGVTFVLVCFVFHLYAFVEAAALRSIVLRYAGVPIATRLSFFLSFSFFCRLFGDVTFSEYFSACSLYMKREYVVRSFLPDVVFSTTLRPRAGFLTSACVRIQSINQINQTSLLHIIESNLNRLGLLSSTHDQRSQQKNGQMTLQPVLINKLGTSKV